MVKTAFCAFCVALLCAFCDLLPHDHEHVSQSIDHAEQRAAGGVELIRVGLLFGCGRARCDACELDVKGLKLRRVAEVDLQLIKAILEVPEARFNRRFSLLVLLQPCL